MNAQNVNVPVPVDPPKWIFPSDCWTFSLLLFVFREAAAVKKDLKVEDALLYLDQVSQHYILEIRGWKCDSWILSLRPG